MSNYSNLSEEKKQLRVESAKKFSSLLDSIEPVKPIEYSEEELDYFMTINTIFKKYDFVKLNDGKYIANFIEDNKYTVLVVLAFGKIMSMVTRQTYESIEECESAYQEILRRDKFERW